MNQLYQLLRERLTPLRPQLVPAGPGANLLRFADDKETVEVQRRRRPTGSSGSRERADTPEREREKETAAPPPRPPSGGGGGSYPPSGGGGQLPPSGGYQPSGGMGSLPTGGFRPPGGCMGMGLFAVIAVVGLGVFLLMNLFGGGGGGNSSQQSAGVQQQVATIAAQAAQSDSAQSGSAQSGFGQAAQATNTPASLFGQQPESSGVDRAGEEAEWLVMLYQDADDKILEQDIYIDMNEAERAGSADHVHVVAQVDRFQGGFSGDGDWTGTKRFYLTPDADLGRIGSVEVADLGEANMADGQTLVDFVTWAVETYPAEKHVLILSDHGMGWPGGWTDPTAPRSSGGGSPMEQRMSDQIFLNELDEALTQIRQQTGIDKFELIGMDACLMAHIEVFSALEPHARYAVASQETEPAVGWAYAAFLSSLAGTPTESGDDLASYIVASYIDEDERIQDDNARAEMTGSGRGMFGAPSAQQLAAQLEQNVTLSAVDLSALPELMDSLNQLAFALQGENPKAVAQARSYAQSYTSVFGRNVPASYIDLGNFTQLLDGNVRGEAAQALDRVQSALDKAVVAERHGSGKKGSNGISIYFPNTDLFSNPVAGAASYTAIADRFAQESLWDEFLGYHYTGRTFDAAASGVAAPAAEAVTAPASGEISVSPITASADSVALGDTVRLSVDISGDNIGYVKLLVGYYDPDSNSIYVADSDYLESPETREAGGVYYPVWPEDEFTLAFEWEPIVFAVSDGDTLAEAVFNPEDYGEAYEDALYSVDGLYTYADDGSSRQAIMYFRNGEMTQVFGFNGDATAGAPREILPTAGDTFTVYEQWLDLNDQGRVANVAYETGKTITFGSDPITWETLDAAAGEYVVGFLVEDLDGKQYPVTTTIEVE